MSLTRDQWTEMWTSILTIQVRLWNKHLTKQQMRDLIQDELNRIKQQIQSVIGQME